MKNYRTLRNRTFWKLSKLVEFHLRAKGHRVKAQFLDVLLTYFVVGFRFNQSSTRYEKRALKYEIRKYRLKKDKAHCK